MAEDLLTHKNISMLGEGFYSRVSLGPKAVIDHCESLVLNALESIPHNRFRPLTIADYGSADGGTSLDLMRSVVEHARRLTPTRPISITYTDLPDADFATLYRYVNNEVNGRQGYLDKDNVFVYCSGTSFYKPIFPTETLDLAFSASAMHYLSRRPVNIMNHIHSVGSAPHEHIEYQHVAREDWKRILLRRSSELASGGIMVSANFCVDERGHYLGNTGGENLFDNYNVLWEGLRNDRIISDGEYTNTAFQQHYKTIDEFLDPMTNTKHDVYQSGLRLKEAKTETIKCPFASAYNRGELSAEEFSRQFVNTHRSWTETTFRAGLSASRSDAQKNDIINELYSRFEAMVLSKPAGHAKDLLHLYIVAEKK